MPRYSFAVCRASGEQVGEAIAAKSRQITRTLNQPTTATLSLQLGDPLASSLTPGTGRLKVFRAATPLEAVLGLTRKLVFYGFLPLTGLRMGGASDTVEAVFQDPRYLFSRRYALGTETYAATAQGAIIMNGSTGLVDVQNARSGGQTWIIPGSISANILRDRTFTQQLVAQLIQDLTEVIDGPDVDCQPYDGFTIGGARTMGQLNVYDRQGTDRPNAIFGYGPDTISNVTDATLSYLDATTLATVTGTDANGLPVISSFGSPINEGLGLLEQVEADPDVSQQATVDAKARGIIAEENLLRPVVTIGSPLPDAPRAFVDYDLGDTIRVNLKRGCMVYTGAPRVHGFTLTLDQQGGEDVSLVLA